MSLLQPIEMKQFLFTLVGAGPGLQRETTKRSKFGPLKEQAGSQIHFTLLGGSEWALSRWADPGGEAELGIWCQCQLCPLLDGWGGSNSAELRIHSGLPGDSNVPTLGICENFSYRCTSQPRTTCLLFV